MKLHRTNKDKGYYERQFNRTAANKQRRALKAKRKRPLKPGAAERLKAKHDALRHKRNLRRQAEREAQAQLQRKRERELAELKENLRRSHEN